MDDFRSFEDTTYLIARKGHNYSVKCLEGKIIGQVWCPDLNESEVYFVRACNVCGNPFVDGFNVVKKDENLELYLARDSEIKGELSHLHVTNREGETIENPFLSILYIQPNNFIKNYTPDQRVLHIIDQKEKMKVDSWLENYEPTDAEGELMKTVLSKVAGRHIFTTGRVILNRIYSQHYNNEKPLPPKLLDLINQHFGKEAYDFLIKDIKEANEIPADILESRERKGSSINLSSKH